MPPPKKKKLQQKRNQKSQRKQVKSKPVPKKIPLPELLQMAVHRQGEQGQPLHLPLRFRQMDMWTALILAQAQALGVLLPYRSQFPDTRSQQSISWMLLLKLQHYFANAKGVINKILSGQTPNVDAVSGATYSSNGIIQAVQNALSQAIPSRNQAGVTPTPTSTPTPKPTKKPVPTPKPGEEQIYKDGTYTGTGKGYSGTITLTAKIKKGVITSLKVENTDTPAFFQKAWDKLEGEILEKQAAEGIDTVSGATYSSKGILEAFKDILKQAQKGETKPTVTPEITPTPTAAPTPTATPAPTVTPTPEASLTPEPSLTPEASPTPEPTAVPEPEGRYIDGTYTASSYGFEGMVNVTVTISGGQIVSIEQSNGDSPEYFDYAWNTILPQVTANQSPEGIDAASGATYSSEGILNAIRKALAQAAR